MNRWDPAPPDGGISIDHQQAEAEARRKERDRERYLTDLDDDYRERATVLLHAIRVCQSAESTHKVLLIALEGAMRDGVRRAENGRKAEWILER